jgi:cytochrome o ubiquinol oxidase subunit 3
MNMNDKNLFGLWMYLMTDLVLFASLFAVFVVLRGQATGVGGALFETPTIAIETFVLLTSSFTCGVALLCARERRKYLSLAFLLATFLLGAAFLWLEVSEFSRLVHSGTRLSSSGFVSSYFALVGTHGLHIAVALIWMFALLVAVVARGLTEGNVRKLTLLSYFWHFLDLIWIFIFTFVYLLALL